MASLRNREGKPRWPIDCARPGQMRRATPTLAQFAAKTPHRARLGQRVGPDFDFDRVPPIWRAGRKNRTALYRNFGLPLLPKETALRAITLACNYGRACGYLTVDGRDVGDVLIAKNLAHTYSVDAIRARGASLIVRSPTQAGRS
jgi:hypothetical protein